MSSHKENIIDSIGNGGKMSLSGENQMSKIRINSQSQLEMFLKILAEESINKSKKMLLEAEGEEEEEEEGAEEEVEETDDEQPEEEVEEEDEPTEQELSLGGEEISFISFRDNIDSVRAGKSLKRSEVKEEVEVWFNRMTAQDKRFFHDALSTLGTIMTGETSGANAPLPGGPVEDQGAEEIEAEPTQQPDAEPAAGGIEPPIKIGESQDKMLIRMRVRELMGY